MLSKQNELQQHQQALDNIKAMAEGADRFKDNPQMHDTYLGHLNDLLDQLPKGPKQKSAGASSAGADKSGGGGIKDFFGKLFGGGKQPDTNQPQQPRPNEGIDREATAKMSMPQVPSPVSPDSHTYGQLPESFTPPVVNPVPAQAVPQSATPVPAPVQGPAMASPAQAATQEPLKIPSPVDIAADARENWWKTAGFAQKPQFVGRDPEHEGLRARSNAQTIADKLLGVTDQHLQEYNAANPQNPIRTLSQAVNDPRFGPEFKQVMDSVQEYENAGLLTKGRLEGWQKMRFDDVRFGAEKYDPTKTAESADGSRMQFNPATQRYDIPVGGQKFDAQVDDAFKTVAENPGIAKNPDAFRTTSPHVAGGLSNPLADKVAAAKTVIDAYTAKLATGDQAKMNTDEQLRMNYKKEMDQGIFNGPAHKALFAYMPVAHPQPPPSFIMGPPNVNQNGQKTVRLINPKTGKAEDTNLTIPQNFDLDKVMRTEKFLTVPDPTPTDPRHTKFVADVRVFDPVQVKQAFQSGELGGIDPLRSIVNSGKFANDRDRLEMEQFLKQAQNPNPYPPAR